MRIGIIGDAHFRLDLPYGTHFDDGRRDEWEEVKRTVLEATKDCDIIVLLGDVLDKRHNHSSVLSELVEFLKGFGDKEVHIISGNHEKYQGSKTALDFLKGMVPDWHVYTEPTWLALDGPRFTAMFLPYMTNAELGVSEFDEAKEKLMARLKEAPAHVLFHHHTMSASSTPGGTTDLFNEAILDRGQLSKAYKLVFGGHIHEPSEKDNVYIAGSLFTNSAGETKRRILKLDTETMKVESVPLPVRPIHNVAIRQENDMTFMKIPDRAIVKATVTTHRADVEKIREMMSRFDAYVLIEDYPDERVKAHANVSEDLSIEALLKTYAQAKGLDEARLLSTFDLIKS